MDETKDKPKGCGCGNANATVVFSNSRPPLTEQQENLMRRIHRANQKKSIYKTNTRYFI
jgi:hypothetical protein